MSLQYLNDAVEHGDREKLIRYVRLHLGDGNEDIGRSEIDKAWVEALKPLLDVAPTERSGEIRQPGINWAQARREGIEIERTLGLRG